MTTRFPNTDVISFSKSLSDGIMINKKYLPLDSEIKRFYNSIRIHMGEDINEWDFENLLDIGPSLNSIGFNYLHFISLNF